MLGYRIKVYYSLSKDVIGCPENITIILNIVSMGKYILSFKQLIHKLTSGTLPVFLKIWTPIQKMSKA